MPVTAKLGSKLEAEIEPTDIPSLKSLLQLKKRYEAPKTEDLPPSYHTNSDKEELFLWAAGNFLRQIRQKFPALDPKFLVCRNECNARKLVVTFIKPTVLPYSHLFDIGACSKFVADFVSYLPQRSMGNKVNSPTSTLATQTGNSVEMSNLLVSLLNGFGFQSYVVVGTVDHNTAKMNLTQEFCDLVSNDEENETGIPEVASEGDYVVAEPPRLKSDYLAFLETLDRRDPSGEDDMKQSSLLTTTSSKSGLSSTTKSGFHSDANKDKSGDDASDGKFEDDAKADWVHGWVYVHVQDRAFFIEATTGEKKALSDPSYKKITAIWNQENYWLCNDEDLSWKTKRTIELHSNEKWIKFVADLEKAQGQANKRLLTSLTPWLGELHVPQTSFDLVYRLGQKVEVFSKTKVEYFAPYLLKDGMVQRVQTFKFPIQESGEDSHAPQNFAPIHVVEKFRHRADKLWTRETFPETDQVVERFLPGRGDHLKEHDFFKLTSAHMTEYSLTFYFESRPDGLERRIFKDMEVVEHYRNRPDDLLSMKAIFMVGEKKFGPADNTKGHKEISRIVETYKREEDNDEDEESGDKANLGRILDTSKIMEKIFDIESDRILLKFQRERGQIFYKSAEFVSPRNPEEADKLSIDDCKVYMVDPRQEKPSKKELLLIHEDQLKHQEVSIRRVKNLEKEMADMLETRMRELSANEMEVWIYDVKRNPQVSKGRSDEEKLAKLKEESVVDLELDFLAPYLERYQDLDAMSKMQAAEVRDECLTNIKLGLREKEAELEDQIKVLNNELREKVSVFNQDDLNSKKFLLNVLESRLSRQKRHTTDYYSRAEKRVMSDPRIMKCL